MNRKQYNKSLCKQIETFLAILCPILLASCTDTLTPSDLTGEWEQVEIASCIDDGEPELSNEPATWTFCDDNSYTIIDGDGNETGRWLLTADSLLIILTEGVDSLRTTYHILLCNDDSLVGQTSTESDYGIITETTTLIRTK